MSQGPPASVEIKRREEYLLKPVGRLEKTIDVSVGLLFDDNIVPSSSVEQEVRHRGTGYNTQIERASIVIR
jgi:hypothetical protein